LVLLGAPAGVVDDTVRTVWWVLGRWGSSLGVHATTRAAARFASFVHKDANIAGVWLV
jgi:hypothetical protein